MQYNILKEEIQNDPLNIGYAAMTEADIVASLNAVTRTNRVFVPLWKIKKHAIENGYWVAIKAAAADLTSPLHTVAVLTADYVDDNRFENLALDLPSTQQLLGGLVAGGIITAAQSVEINDMGNELQSRATELGLPIVNVGHMEIIRG